jgi:hypothetical protein
MNAAIRSFVNDDQLKAVLVLIALDLVLGVGDAIRAKSFRLSYIVDFLRNDVLGKVFPWFVLFAAGFYAPNTDILGLGLDTIADAAWVGVAAALGASILNSIRDFGVPLPDAIAGGDPETAENQAPAVKGSTPA